MKGSTGLVEADRAVEAGHVPDRPAPRWVEHDLFADAVTVDAPVAALGADPQASKPVALPRRRRYCPFTMRTSLDHLPASKQRELQRIQAILFEEFEDAVRLATSAKKKAGRILRIILFGSFARGTWVEDQANGYLSDWDLLIIVNRDELTDVATYWYKAEDRFGRPGGIKRPVNLIVHTLSEVNNALAQGQYFFKDIVEEGITLYELSGHPLVDPRPLSPDKAYEMAKGYFDEWYPSIARRLRIARTEIEAAGIPPNPKWLNDAAFTLHQAVERAYGCLLLACTQYLPKTHNLARLRSLARNIDTRLEAAWPSDNRLARRRFQLLKHAYVDARYSLHYKIDVEDLEWLAGCVEQLRELVALVCKERLDELKSRG